MTYRGFFNPDDFYSGMDTEVWAPQHPGLRSIPGSAALQCHLPGEPAGTPRPLPSPALGLKNHSEPSPLAPFLPPLPAPMPPSRERSAQRGHPGAGGLVPLVPCATRGSANPFSLLFRDSKFSKVLRGKALKMPG